MLDLFKSNEEINNHMCIIFAIEENSYNYCIPLHYDIDKIKKTIKNLNKKETLHFS